MGALKQSVSKLRAMRPSQIRKEAQREFRLVLIASDELDREALSRALLPDGTSPEQRRRALGFISTEAAAGAAHVTVCSARAAGAQPPPSDYVVIDPDAPEPGLLALLRAHAGLRLALARTFPVLRELLARELIRAVAARNAAVAAISALPEVIPTPLSLVLALGEMGSDSILITGNQIALAFELAALRGEAVGWRAQSRPVLSIMVGALGWRALARGLVGLVPAGIGLSAKAAIAYSGTMAVGTALWKLPATNQRRMPKPSTRVSTSVATPVPATIPLARRRHSA